MGPSNWKQAEAQATADGVEEPLVFFKQHLGEDWSGWADARPLARSFFVRFQGQAIGPVAFETLTALAATSTGKAIHRTVMQLGSKEWAHYEGTELELLVAAACLEAGLKTVLRESSKPGADLVVFIEGSPILMECKRLQPRDLDREVSDLMELLHDLAWKADSGRVQVVLDGSSEEFVHDAPKAVALLNSFSPECQGGNWDFGSLRRVVGFNFTRGCLCDLREV